ncbi:ribosome small subunit-dependent GTPase A [Lentilactobacillus kisonensis F0435]|uniref:Ribosome small subunit-dependent GTPase A n=1 Tax=Lentilactobacillus kisonensis F0435 TaxID=797516 RepID=H1LGD4_9LACO|nr:ribosome small subunit-dependent GTPase A [Lentilactobacillus kisonensis F0435]
MIKGKIFQSLSGFYDVHADGKVYRTRARGNFRKRKITPLVGDDVEFQIEDGDKGYILRMLPRKNSLVRPPIANIDQAIVATAATQPEFSSNLLDRQLIALEISHIKPIIYFTKTDLLSTAQRDQLQTVAMGYQAIPYDVIFPEQAFDDSSLDELQTLLAGKENVIMGQTGAGKSTLLNHLAPELNLKTGEISAALNRGKHTTRKVALLQVGTGLIADTPGFSSYDTLDN